MSSVTARLKAIGGLTVKVGGTDDEASLQLKQNGKALASVTLHADKLLTDNTPQHLFSPQPAENTRHL